MTYPKQLITSLCDQLQSPLTDFFAVEQRKIFSQYEEINSLAAETMWEFVKDSTAKADLSSILGTQIKNRNQKKKRWTDAFQNSIKDSSPSDKTHPLHFIYEDFNSLSAHRFIKIYDVSTVEEAVEGYRKLFEEWNANDKNFLIGCPLIDHKTKNQITSCFKIDLIINLIQIIMESYDGNINSYFSKKPELLLDNPVFSPDKFSVPLRASLDSYVANLVDFDSDNMMFRMLVPRGNGDDPNEKIRVFDQRDSHILMFLVNNLTADFYESGQIMLEVGAIAKSINSRPNSHLYDNVKERLHSMATVNFQICSKDDSTTPILTFSLLDEVLITEKNNKEYAVITFGHALFESITKRKMISVTSSSYNSLEQETSRILYHNLQRERAVLSRTSSPTKEGYLYKAYDYSYFQRAILFKKKKKADNIQLIRTTLDEFVDKKIALAKYSYDPDKGQFHLHYFTLSDDERVDFLGAPDTAGLILEVRENAAAE